MSTALFEVPASGLVVPAEPGTALRVGSGLADETEAVGAILSHPDAAVSHLILWLQDKPRWAALCRAVTRPLQALEDLARRLQTQVWDIDQAEGVQLDRLGRLVRQPREGRLDPAYRAAIRVRILVNLSDGKIEQLYDICTGLVPGASVFIQENYPCAMIVYFYTAITGATPADVAKLLRQAKAGGVRLDLVYPYPGGLTVGAVDGSPAGGTIGAVDGSPVGGLVSPVA